MASGERKAPEGEPGWVHLVDRPNVCDGGAPVLELPPHVDELARLAAAVAEMPEVEGERRQPSLAKRDCEPLQPADLDPAESVRQDHTRSGDSIRCGSIQRPRTRAGAGRKPDILYVEGHSSLLGRRQTDL